MQPIQNHTRKFYFLFVALSLVCATSRAVELNSLFSDNVVLQQNKPLPIWGTGKEGEKITMKLGGRAAAATVSGGKWSVKLDALPEARAKFKAEQPDLLKKFNEQRPTKQL